MASVEVGRYRERRVLRQARMHKVDPEETPPSEAAHMASFLGIDLSKETFHAFLLSDRGEAKRVFPNTSKGFDQLTAWLKNRRAVDVHICMEATGAYWEALALYLHGLNHRISVVNPARIKAFAQSELLRTKTDAVDAALTIPSDLHRRHGQAAYLSRRLKSQGAQST